MEENEKLNLEHSEIDEEEDDEDIEIMEEERKMEGEDENEHGETPQKTSLKDESLRRVPVRRCVCVYVWVCVTVTVCVCAWMTNRAGATKFEVVRLLGL